MKKLLLLCLISLSLCAEETTTASTLSYPDGELGNMVRLGEAITKNTNTHPLTKDLVGNSLTCKNCHLAAEDGRTGTSKTFGTFIASATAFPAYSKRSQAVITLQDRSNDCFMRSMNGKRPINNSKASMAIASYITWLSTGLPLHPNARFSMSSLNVDVLQAKKETFNKLQKKSQHKNYTRGEKIFGKKCATCHQKNGEGTEAFPPLWGQDKSGKWFSYNSGAGMAELDESAIWMQSNMPFGQGGSLSDQEAADVALFINAQPRADFKLKDDKGTIISSESVRQNFKLFGLDVDKIRGDKITP